MEKMSLLEKLKTLNQWQLQQQLHLAKLKAHVGKQSSGNNEISYPDEHVGGVRNCGYYGKGGELVFSEDKVDKRYSYNKDDVDEKAIGNDKENIETNKYKDNLVRRFPSVINPSLFTNTMSSTSLTNALNTVDINSENGFRKGPKYTEEHSNGLDVSSCSKMINKEINPTDFTKLQQHYTVEDTEIQDNFSVGERGKTSLKNWHLDGLQTVKFQPYSLDYAISIDNAVKVSHDHLESGFSNYEVTDYRQEVEGVTNTNDDVDEFTSALILSKPPHLTSDKEWELPAHSGDESKMWTDIQVDRDQDDGNNKQYDGNLSVDSVDLDRTVLEKKDGKVSVDEIPIQSKLNDAVTFEDMIQKELQNEFHSDTVESKLNTSTPMKKKHKFLRRGEGLKRFEKGNITKCKEEAIKLKAEKEKMKKQTEKRKNIQFNINPPAPNITAQQCNTNNNNYNRPGLPLKLKLRRQQQTSSQKTISVLSKTGSTMFSNQSHTNVQSTDETNPCLFNDNVQVNSLDPNNLRQRTSENQSKSSISNTAKSDAIPSKHSHQMTMVQQLSQGLSKENATLGSPEIEEHRNDEENSNDSDYEEFFSTYAQKSKMESPFSGSVSSSLEASFQNMLKQYNAKEEAENKDLNDFEVLEEAAENMSLSSNCSLVMKLLGKKKTSKQMCNDLIKEEDRVTASIQNENVINEKQEQSRQLTSSYEFEDEKSWSDSNISILSSDDRELENTIIYEPNSTESHSKVISTPDHLKSNLSLNHIKVNTSLNSESSSSDLIENTSPSIKMTPPKRIISKKRRSEEELDSPVNTNQQSQASPDSLISETVKNKLAELDGQIKKFRLENEKLEKLRYEREKEISELRKESEIFRKQKNEELASIESYRNEETKKLKIERKVFEKYQKAAKQFPNKQEREQIKELKGEIDQLKEELKLRESRWNSASHRFRSRINELEEHNYELRQEIKLFEEERLERWKSTQQGNKKKTSMLKKTPIEKDVIISSPESEVKNVVRPYDWESPNAPILALSLSPTAHPDKHLQKGIKHSDGKTEVVLPDQSRLVTFPNGTKKSISADGKMTSISFFNGDVKKILDDKRVVYYYAESQTTHTTFPDGLEVLEFPNKQVEKRYPDGKTEVIFPDNTVKYLQPDGSEETLFHDGTVQKIDKNKIRTILFPNGQREIHTSQYKRREYPNGTVKTVYEDGRQETKYSNGRLRVKDKDGNLLIDSGPNS